MISLSIPRSSWKSQPPQFEHAFPPQFSVLGKSIDIDLGMALLQMGVLGTPLFNVSNLQSALWPILRYAHVFSDVPMLRLLGDWQDVDFHQKAVASDDFGVGFSAEFIRTTFGLLPVAHGASFVRRLAELGLLSSGSAKTPKKGPNKSPDFVYLTGAGKLLIVEAKGSTYSLSKLRDSMGTGIAQKQSFEFSDPAHEAAYVDQRLICGTYIAREGVMPGSFLEVIDPAPRNPVRLSKRIERKHLREAVLRNYFARLILTAGLTETARALARPNAQGPDVLGRLNSAISSEREIVDRWQEDDDSYWYGHNLAVQLAAPVRSGDRIYRRAKIRYGISDTTLKRLLEPATSSPFFESQYPDLATRTREKIVYHTEDRAEIRHPQTFVASLYLG